MLDTATCDHCADAASAQQPTVLVVVIAAIGEEKVGLLARSADLAGDRPGVQIVQQRQ